MALDPAAAYDETHRTITALIHECTDAELAITVPATPLWSVLDVVRHVCGVAHDAVYGDVPLDLNPMEAWHTDEGKRRGDEYTARHIESRVDASRDDILAEWDGVTARMLPMVAGQVPFPQPVPLLEFVGVTDLAVHSQDIRGALRRPGDRESAAVGIALAGYATGLGLRVASRGLPALAIRYGGRERMIGTGPPAATWSGERYEVFRALSGRRSRRQIAAMDWDGDPTPYLSIISQYGERADDLVE